MSHFMFGQFFSASFIARGNPPLPTHQGAVSKGPLTESQSVKKNLILQIKKYIHDSSSSAIAGVRPCTGQNANQVSKCDTIGKIFIQSRRILHKPGTKKIKGGNLSQNDVSFWTCNFCRFLQKTFKSGRFLHITCTAAHVHMYRCTRD